MGHLSPTPNLFTVFLGHLDSRETTDPYRVFHVCAGGMTGSMGVVHVCLF